MRFRKIALLSAAFLAASVFGAGRAVAQQYIYQGENYSDTNYAVHPTYQQHYPAGSYGTSQQQQYPAATSSAYPSYQPPQAAPAQTAQTQYAQTQYAQTQATQQAAPQQYPAAPSSAWPSYQPPQAAQAQYALPQTTQAAPQPRYQTAQNVEVPAITQPNVQPPSSQPYQPPAAGNLQQYPSFQYNQQLDPHYQPSYQKSGSPNPAPSGSYNEGHPYMGLETRSGLELTGQFAYYRYEEPSLSVEEKSDVPFIGLNARGTFTFGSNYFLTGEGRYAFTDTDYTGSGEIDDRPVDSWEWRGLFGKDFISQTFSLTPYTGFGYRTLFNDNRGITSDGAAGYRRYNQLYYLPIGIQPRTHIDSNARLTASFEYDFLIHGLQKSDLADAGLGDPNIKNVQSSGYGLRGDIMYETRTWAIGPYFTYWNIDDSKTKLALDNSVTSCGGLGAPCILVGDEPANSTIEAGIQFRYHFF